LSVRLFCCATFISLTGASMLHADALIPFATTKCILNGVAAPCQAGFPLPDHGAGVYANTSLASPSVNAGAATDIESGLTSGSSSIVLDMWATTAGPVRTGFIDFVCGADGDGSFGTAFPSSALIVGVGGCSGPMGHSIGDHVPFTLGVPFEIVLTAEARAHTDPLLGDATGGSTASISFTVNGGGVELLGPLTVPEPSYLGVIAGGSPRRGSFGS
jgi:hypothetical protein